MNNRTRTKIRWAVIVLLLVCGCTYWLVFDSKIGSALFLANGILQLLLEIRHGVPIRVPHRRKPIIIERLRYPNG